MEEKDDKKIATEDIKYKYNIIRKNTEKIKEIYVEITNKYGSRTIKNKFLEEVKNNPTMIVNLPKGKLSLLEKEYNKQIERLDLKIENMKKSKRSK